MVLYISDLWREMGSNGRLYQSSRFHLGQINHQKHCSKSHHGSHLVDVCLLFWHQVQQGQDATDCLIINYHCSYQTRNGSPPSHFTPQYMEHQSPRYQHSKIGHIPMVELNHRYILKKVLPQRFFLRQPIWHHLTIHKRPSIINPTCIDTSNKSTRQDVENQAFDKDNTYEANRTKVLCLGEVSWVDLCWSYEEGKCMPDQSSVHGSSHAEMDRQSVGANSRSSLILCLFLESTLNHPPSNTPLQSSQSQKTYHPQGHFSRKVSPPPKDAKRNHEHITQCHSHLSMKEFNPVYGFEGLKRHFPVDSLKFNTFLVLLELNHPLLIITRIFFSVG